MKKKNWKLNSRWGKKNRVSECAWLVFFVLFLFCLCFCFCSALSVLLSFGLSSSRFFFKIILELRIHLLVLTKDRFHAVQVEQHTITIDENGFGTGAKARRSEM